jgi:hypothetical protein
MANLDQGAVVSFCPSKETLKIFSFSFPWRFPSHLPHPLPSSIATVERADEEPWNA